MLIFVVVVMCLQNGKFRGPQKPTNAKGSDVLNCFFLALWGSLGAPAAALGCPWDPCLSICLCPRRCRSSNKVEILSSTLQSEPKLSTGFNARQGKPRTSWILLAHPGSFWLCLALPVSFWLCLAPPSSSWLLLTPPGFYWLFLAPVGCS